jgi:hypothetical protein
VEKLSMDPNVWWSNWTTDAGKPQLGEVRFLVNSDEGQYLSLAAVAAASGIIRRALAEMVVR